MGLTIPRLLKPLLPSLPPKYVLRVSSGKKSCVLFCFKLYYSIGRTVYHILILFVVKALKIN